MVSSVLAGLGEHLSTVMIWGGAVSSQSPIAATFSRIVSRVLCFCELLSTVIIWGGAVSNHEELIPDLVLPISLSLSTTHTHPSAQKFGVRSLAPFDISGVKNKNWKRNCRRKNTRHLRTQTLATTDTHLKNGTENRANNVPQKRLGGRQNAQMGTQKNHLLESAGGCRRAEKTPNTSNEHEQRRWRRRILGELKDESACLRALKVLRPGRNRGEHGGPDPGAGPTQRGKKSSTALPGSRRHPWYGTRSSMQSF